MPSSLGPMEILVILVVALIVLGPSKLPQAGRQVGKALAEIRRWSQEMKSEVTQVFDAEAAPTPQSTAPVITQPAPITQPPGVIQSQPVVQPQALVPSPEESQAAAEFATGPSHAPPPSPSPQLDEPVSEDDQPRTSSPEAPSTP